MRIVSWNVNGRLGACSKIEQLEQLEQPHISRCQDIVSILQATKPDIVCLQEVNSREEAAWIARQLNMFQPKWPVWHVAGLTILTRFPIIEIQVQSIPNSFYNGIVAVKVSNPEKKHAIWVVNIHLDSRAYTHSEQRRHVETQFILRYITRLLQKQKAPIVVAGDWNSVDHHDLRVATTRNQCKRIRDIGRLPSHLMQREQWNDAMHLYSHERRTSTWIPTAAQDPHCTIERIDRIYVKGLQVRFAQHIGPKETRVILHGRPWPTGKDHKLVLAEM